MAGTMRTLPATGTGASPTEVALTTAAFQIIEFDRPEGKTAQTQARHPRVKLLAQQFTAGANDFAAQLAPVAANAGIRPPAVLRNDLRVRLGHMRLEQGLNFGCTYVADQIASHEEEVPMQDSMGAGDISPPFAKLMRRRSLIRRNLDTLRALQAELGTGRRWGLPPGWRPVDAGAAGVARNASN